MNIPIKLISALGVGMVLILSPIPAHAENAEQRIVELEKQVEELQKLVTELQKRVAALEPIPKQDQDAGDISKPAATGDWSVKANWRALEKGMTKEQVLKLLGEPVMAREMPYGHNWFYKSGYAMFDQLGRLEMWSEPL